MPSKPTNRGVVAGFLLLSTNLLCVGLGAGIGAVVNAVLSLAAVGFFVGFFSGIWVVYTRFRDI